METSRKRGSADGATIVDSHCKKQLFYFKTTEDINKMSIKKVPKTTTYSTQWAMNNFDCWRLARNSRSVDEQVKSYNPYVIVINQN